MASSTPLSDEEVGVDVTGGAVTEAGAGAFRALVSGFGAGADAPRAAARANDPPAIPAMADGAFRAGAAGSAGLSLVEVAVVEAEASVAPLFELVSPSLEPPPGLPLVQSCFPLVKGDVKADGPEATPLLDLSAVIFAEVIGRKAGKSSPLGMR